MDAGQSLAEPEWLEDTPSPLEDWDDLPPEAYQDDLGLSPADLAALNAEREAAQAEDEAVTAEMRAGTLTMEDGVPEMVETLAAVGGDLSRKTDAQVLGVTRMCGELLSRIKARMYESLNELAARRPARRWDSREAEAEIAREEPDGPGHVQGVASPPRFPSREMIQETMLEMDWTEYRASVEAHRAVDLERRLPAAFARLKQGLTDDDHVKILYEYTWDLSDANARKLDARVSPWMEGKTTGELRDRLRREVIRIDPGAAERRRKRSERHARVSLYANDSGTATYAIEDMPAERGAAVKARVNALARAAKSAGSRDSLSLLEAEISTGLLLGTLPHIPPPSPGGGGSGAPDPAGSGDGGGESAPDVPPGAEAGGRDVPWPDEPPDDDGTREPEEERPAGSPPGDGRAPGWWAWPPIPPTAGAAAPGCAALPGWLRPATPGRIRLLAPWRTLTGRCGEPGEVPWFGAITPRQTRELAAAAASDRSASWQVIVTDDAGRAIGTAPIRRRKTTGTAGPPGMIDEVTLTVQASYAAELARSPDLRQRIRRDLVQLGPDTDHEPLADVLTEAAGAANRAAAGAARRARLDAAAGGCAHMMETKGYRVTGTLRRWVAIRDRTCRHPACRRRALQCDQDHTVPYDKGGRTCPCALGSLCRVHHQLKQLPGWHLSQDGGVFTWTTPAGLTYREEPYRYPV